MAGIISIVLGAPIILSYTFPNQHDRNGEQKIANFHRNKYHVLSMNPVRSIIDLLCECKKKSCNHSNNRLWKLDFYCE